MENIEHVEDLLAEGGGIAPPPKFTKEEIEEREYHKRRREIHVARARAAVVRSQIVEAYAALENIRFDYVSDTAFRDKITLAKRNLELALQDYMLSDTYYDKMRDKHNGMTSAQYAESKRPALLVVGDCAPLR